MYTKPNLTPRVTRLALIAAGLSTLAAHSAVTLSHYYSLGEDGSTPLDSIAGADFSGTTGSSPSVIAGSANGSIGSSSYLSYSGGSYSFGADVQSSMPTNNFAVGLWVRTSTINPTRTDSVIFQGNQNGGGDADLILSDGGSGATDAWAASVSGAAWVGPARGVDGSAVANEWAHIAYVRDGGSSTLYINGVAQTGSPTNNISWGNSLTLGTTSADVQIDVDDLRLYTFSAGEGADAVSTMFTAAVPEPSSTALIGLAGLGFILRRKRA